MQVHTGKTISIPKANQIKWRFLSDNLGGNVAYSLTKSVHVFVIIRACACVY